MPCKGYDFFEFININSILDEYEPLSSSERMCMSDSYKEAKKEERKDVKETKESIKNYLDSVKLKCQTLGYIENIRRFTQAYSVIIISIEVFVGIFIINRNLRMLTNNVICKRVTAVQ